MQVFWHPWYPVALRTWAELRIVWEVPIFCFCWACHLIISFALQQVSYCARVFIASLTVCWPSPGIPWPFLFLAEQLSSRLTHVSLEAVPHLWSALFCLSVLFPFLLCSFWGTALSSQTETDPLFKRRCNTVSGFIPFIKILMYLLFQFLSTDLIFSWND